VAFQVVLIMDNARVVVPQNLAVAANYDCYRCITAAIANQLVFSVDEEPGEEELRQLGEVWGDLLAFARTITSYTVNEVVERLEVFKDQIVAIVGEERAITTDASSSTTTPPPPAGGASEPPAPTADATPPAESSTPPTPAQESTTPSSPEQESTSSPPTESTAATDAPSEPESPSPAPTPSEDPAPTASPQP
jgi:putative peptide zinc metalloprotease protein